MFASRLRQIPGRNRLSLALDRRRSMGLPVIDLTLSNPTRAGFVYPAGLLDSLAHDRALCYEPEPFGLLSARQAVVDDFRRRGTVVPADRIVLTSSTSEAYSFLFKLLCDPGDAVLAPRPSYPLIEHLTDLDGIAVEHYELDFHGRWTIDLAGLRERLAKSGGRRIRAIVAISPNNPTGSVLKDDDLETLAVLAHEHDLAIIADEVFADYPLGGSSPQTALRQQAVLTFGLGGLSKTVGLPQVKLGWIGVGGPGPVVSDAMDRLEVISDTYLSVSTPVQLSLPQLLHLGTVVRTQIQQRVCGNFARLQAAASSHPECSVLPAEAGWSAVVQVPATKSEEAIVLDLLDRAGILVHPGYFFDFEREAFLVVSLLPQVETFSSGVEAMFTEIGRFR